MEVRSIQIYVGGGKERGGEEREDGSETNTDISAKNIIIHGTLIPGIRRKYEASWKGCREGFATIDLFPIDKWAQHVVVATSGGWKRGCGRA